MSENDDGAVFNLLVRVKVEEEDQSVEIVEAYHVSEDAIHCWNHGAPTAAPTSAPTPLAAKPVLTKEERIRQNQTDTTRPPRITLHVQAHGKVLYAHNDFQFAIDRENILILNYGMGRCGLSSYGNDKDLFGPVKKVIQTSTEMHDPDTGQTMKNLQPVFKKMFGEYYKSSFPIYINKNKTNPENATILNDEHSKLYHPILDCSYAEIVPKFDCTITQVFNAPEAFLPLVGRNLYHKEAIQAFKKEKPLAVEDIEAFAKHFPEMRNSQVKLSEIIAFCKLLGFEYVNIFESACREVYDVENSTYFEQKTHIFNEFNRREDETTNRLAKAFGGGGTRPVAAAATKRRRFFH